MRLAKAQVASKFKVKSLAQELVDDKIFNGVPTSTLKLLMSGITEESPQGLLPSGSVVILYDGEKDGESLGEEMALAYPSIKDRIFAFLVFLWKSVLKQLTWVTSSTTRLMYSMKSRTRSMRHVKHGTN